METTKDIQREAREILFGSAEGVPVTAVEATRDPIEAAQVHKVRENRARRTAARRGWKLVKSRRRDPQALNYGEFMIVDQRTGFVVIGGRDDWDWLSLEQVEDWLLDQPAT